MRITVKNTKKEMGAAAAEAGADAIRRALTAKSQATIIVATGASQFEMLDQLVRTVDIDWSKVTGFHLDEYVGMPADHPASFRRYLKERFVERVPVPLAEFHYIDAEHDADAEIARLNALIRGRDVDVAFVGIGENGHLAFNDPPADFETEDPYLRVQLDEACRRQQLGEGWFPNLTAVPKEAVSMSVRQILKAHVIVCTVPDERKAEAVRNAVEGPVTPDVPASILQRHPDCRLFVDHAAAALLSDR